MDRLRAASQGTGEELVWSYDRSLDLFSVTLGDPQPAISVECDDGRVLRVDPTTHEVIGVEVYDWERIFLKQHPEIAVPWRQARSPISRLLRHRLVQNALRSVAVATARIFESSCNEPQNSGRMAAISP